ncbi:MAG: aspartyl protease family protein [Sphingomonas sp.]
MPKVFGAIIAAGAVMVAGGTANAADNKCSIGQLLELPVTMIDRQPTVPVELNGHQMRLVADSGAFFSSLSPGVAAEYGFKRRGAPMGLYVSGVGGDIRPDVTTIDNFRLGPVTLHRVDFLVGGSEVGPAGLLGQNILGVADVEYDLGNGVVRLMRPDDCRGKNLAYWADGKPSSVEPIAADSRIGKQTVGVVELNGVKLKAVFDTGAGQTILSSRAAARVGVKPDSPGVEEAGYSNGIGRKMVDTWIGSFDSLKIGDNEEIRKIRLRFGDLNDGGDFDMLIGADFFLSHRVYVSNAIHRMFFTYNGGPVFDLSMHHDGGGKARAALTSAAAYSQRGMASAARHDYASARDDLTHAIALEPKEARYYSQRATIELDMDDEEAGGADLDAAIERAPGDTTARLTRAWLRIKQDDKAAARRDADAVDHALALPSDARFELAELYDTLDLTQQAIRQYGLWIDAHHDDSKLASAYNGRCWLRARAGVELDAAIDDCNRGLHLRSHDPDILDSRAFARLRAGDTKGAVNDYDDALERNPKMPTSLYARGIAKRRLGQTAAGDADIAAAKKLDADIAKTMKGYGLTL